MLEKKSKNKGSQDTYTGKRNNAWMEHLGKYLIDISKYVVTGVIIASIFKDLDDKIMIYILSAVVALIALIVGLVLTNNKKGE